MQEHVQLEVSLEVIMAEIAKQMHALKIAKTEQEREEKEAKLRKLIDLQESAYKGERESILKILKREF